MSKLGMPSVNLRFNEAGIEAILRSERGIVMLILEDKKATIGKLEKNPLTLYAPDDIPDALNEKNKDYILKAFKGYVNTPHRVKIYVQDDVNASVEQDKFKDSLKAIITERWDILAIPTIKQTQCEAVATWVKAARETKHKKVKAVLPNYNADHEGVINFTNTKIVVAGDKEYTTAEYTARIAGLICGTPQTISCTYAPLPELVDCDRYTEDENDAKVNKGEFFVFYDGEKFKVARGVNSLVTTTQGKQEGYQTIKIVETMDMMYDDIRKTAQDSYIGKYTNDYDNKMLLITAIEGYFKQLENGRLLQKDYSEVHIDVEAVKAYLMSNGLYTKEQLANMDDDTIAHLDTRKKVFLKGKVKILDAMEDIEFPVEI